jgi:hypothetical protein
MKEREKSHKKIEVEWRVRHLPSRLTFGAVPEWYPEGTSVHSVAWADLLVPPSHSVVQTIRYDLIDKMET